jgi:DNA invertase Pin-like site-specific DNA recombinase
MRIGYARVSTLDQNLDLQVDALKAAGCDRIFEEKASGARFDREQLNLLFNTLRDGDTLVVWKLDRVGRSLKHLLSICSELKDSNVTFVSLTENIDTTTNTGQLIFNLLASLSEFERNLIKERSAAGRQAARARGIMGGRAKLLNSEQVRALKKMAADTSISIETILQTFKISKSTYYQYLKS